MSFIVHSLPRSRSTWLSFFLSYRGRNVGHDIGPTCASVDEFMGRIGDGTCETGAAFAWPLIGRLRPDLKTVVVLREPTDVAERLARFGLTGQLVEMQKRHDDLLDLSLQPDVLSVDYDALESPETCKRVFEFCLDEPFDVTWWCRLQSVNIQVDMPKQIALLMRNRDRIEVLKAEVRGRLVRV